MGPFVSPGAKNPSDTAKSGVRVGGRVSGVDRREMPPLETAKVVDACNAIQNGQGAYRALVYLSRARPADTDVLIDASQASDLKERWARLWTLAGVFARLARTSDGCHAFLARIEEDWVALHFLSKFVDRGSVATERLFERAARVLLPVLLRNLGAELENVPKAAAFSEMISCVETEESMLRSAIGDVLGEERVEAVLGRLEIREPKADRPPMSVRGLTHRLSERLQSLSSPSDEQEDPQ